jgi:site-specific DNA recombinase
MNVRKHDAAVSRFQQQHAILTNRLRTMYADRLDGRIDAATYDKLSEDYKREQDRCCREIGWHQAAEQSYVE